MTQLDQNSFNESVANGLVLVDFYTPFCGPCRQLAPVLEKLQNVKVVKVDVSQQPEIGDEYQVDVVPTLVFFKEGKQVYRTKGLQSQDLLQAKVNELNG